MSTMTSHTSSLEKKEALLKDMQDLIDQRKILKARSSLKDFCEYVIKDEKTGDKIKIAELQQSWINHIGFCKNNGINALILAPMASGKCVSLETLFTTRDGWKQAKDLVVGDLVLSFDKDTRKPVWTSVLATEYQDPKTMYRIKLDSGKTITCTYDHQFICDTYEFSEWVQANDLIENDHVVVPANWLQGATSPDYYGYGLTKYSDQPTRYDLDRLLTYVNNFDLELDRSLLERSGKIKLADLNLDPIGFNRSGVASFLGGVLDSLGLYNASLKMYEIEYESKELLFQLQFLFQGLGIKSKIVRRIRPKEVIYSLLISRDFTGNVQDKIKCVLTNTRSLLPARRQPEQAFFLERVIEAKEIGPDLSIGVETENHVHVTNGVVTHNTQIVGIALPLYLLGKDPSCRIKMVCLSDDAAKERLGAVQAYIREDEDYHKVFPHIKRDPEKEWSKHNISVISKTKPKDPNLSAKGVISNGIGGRCDILLVDDIFDQRTAISQPATREQINSTYRIVWLTRIDEGGMAIVICTRWHERDLAGEVLNDPAMRDQYGILIQSINADFTGIDIKVIIPDRLQAKYQESIGGFRQI